MKKLTIVLFVVLTVFLCFPFVGCERKKTGKDGIYYGVQAEYFPDTSSLVGTVQVRYQNDTESTLSSLVFSLPANAYRKDALVLPILESHSSAYYDGKSYGGMEITGVEGGTPTLGGIDQNLLTVSLAEPLYPSETATVSLSFITTLARVCDRTGITRNCVQLGHVFPTLCVFEDGTGFLESPPSPIGDPYFAPCATYHVVFTAPSDYVVACGAKEEKRQTLETRTEYTFTSHHARDFALALSKNYKIEKCTAGGVEYRYYYFQDEMPTAHLAWMKTCVETFSSLFGAYPYPCFSLAQTELYESGAEFTGFAFLSSNLGASEESFLSTLAHETAHQWWYALVGNNGGTSAWLDEGLCEFSTALLLDKTGKKKYADSVREAENGYHAYYTVYTRAFDGLSTKMERPLSEYKSEYEYQSIAYEKGLMLFDAIYSSVGKRRTIDALKRYAKENRFQIATPACLVGAFERSGVKVGGLMDSFITGKAIV